MDKPVVRVPYHEIERCAQQIKQGEYPQVYLTIADDGTIQGSWFLGRSDFVLRPGFIVLLDLERQTEESIIYAILMVIRNQEGYVVVR